MVIAPITVEEDEETGTVTIGIAVSDLPEGTYAIKTPSGDIIYVKDAVDGVLTIEVRKNDIDSGGELEIIILNDGLVSIGSVRIQAGVPQTDDGASAILWWVIGGAAVLLAALLIILLAAAKKRQKNASEE